MSDALFDSYMLQNFPGRTLEEIDNIDALRFFRAMGARNIESVESLRKQQQSGVKNAKDIPASTFRKFLEHDRLFSDFEEALLNGKQYNPASDSGEERS